MDDRATFASLASALSGRYDIDREIGRGGMATVYLARDVRHDRRVAVKLLSPELGAVLGAERFLSEIRVTANLQHPNLLPLFDSGEANGLLFYVMPYVEGESLRAKLDREKQLPIEEAVRITTAVAAALDYAHRHGVIHRDLKPENILLHDGQPVVADFGIALAVSNAGGQRVTQTGLSLGTPQYMSPEQATGDRGVDGRTDIYSLGAVAYEMIGGEPPHHGTSAQAIIAKLMTEEARPLTTLRRSVPPYIAGAIQRALEKLPADRWATAKEFSDALNDRHASYGAPVVAGSATPGTALGRWLPWVIAGASLLVAAGVVARRATSSVQTKFMQLPLAQSQQDGMDPRTVSVAQDGQAFAYTAMDGVDSTSRLYVRRFDDLHARRYAGSDSAIYLGFSPDGEWIAFATGKAIRKLRVSTGAISTLGVVDFEPYGVSWGVDTAVIVASGGNLFAFPAAGGAPRKLAIKDSAPHSPRYPLALPDGDRIIYASVQGGGTTQVLEMLRAKSGEVRSLAIEGQAPVAFYEGRLLFLDRAGSLQAIRFDTASGKVDGQASPVLSDIPAGSRTGASVSSDGTLVYSAGAVLRQPVELTSAGARPTAYKAAAYTAVRRSPDGQRLAMAITEGVGSHIFIGKAGTAALDRLTNEGVATRPEWSADSREVMYQSDRDGRSALWIQRADGVGSARKLLDGPGAPLWEGLLSPDGKYLIYRTGTQTSADIWYRSLTGDTTAKPLATTRFGENEASMSPDSRWVAYSSFESGISEIYVLPFPSLDNRVQVTHGGGTAPVWGGNSRLFYGITGNRIASVALKLGAEIDVLKVDTLPATHLYAGQGHAAYDALPDGKGVLVLRNAPSTRSVVVMTGLKERLSALAKR